MNASIVSSGVTREFLGMDRLSPMVESEGMGANTGRKLYNCHLGPVVFDLYAAGHRHSTIWPTIMKSAYILTKSASNPPQKKPTKVL